MGKGKDSPDAAPFPEGAPGSVPPPAASPRSHGTLEEAPRPREPLVTGRRPRASGAAAEPTARRGPRRGAVDVASDAPPAPAGVGRAAAASRRGERARDDRARATAARAPEAPEEALHRAMAATTPRSRGHWARRGLASRAPLDRTVQAMLLRQLYLSSFEQRSFVRAAELAEQVIALAVLPDVAHQDAARAHQALGDVDAAAAHLRLAARVGPPSRRAFHWWTLGCVYHVAQRYDEARAALVRASRWGTTDKPLYQGQLAVVECAAGRPVAGLAQLAERLSAVPAGQGYGRFVLGQIAFHDGRFAEACGHLEAFIRRTTSGRVATAIALDGEVELARRTLAAMRA